MDALIRTSDSGASASPRPDYTRLVEFAVLLFCVVSLFSTALDKLFAIPQITLVDDVFVLSGVVLMLACNVMLWRPSRILLPKWPVLIIVWGGAAVVLIGSVSLVRQLGADVPRILLGAFFFLKPVILFLSGALVAHYASRGFLSRLFRIMAIIAAVFLVLGMLNALFPLQWSEALLLSKVGNEIRLISLFDNAGRTSFFCVVIAALALATMLIAPSRREAAVAVLVLISAIVLLRETLVRKSLIGMALVMVAAAVIAFVQYRGARTRAAVTFLCVVAAFATFLFLQPVIERFADFGGDFLVSDRSRVALALGAIYLMGLDNWNLLLGTGFGTWGGIASGMLYSPFYFELGFDRLWGFYPGSPTYVGDNYLAHVFAEIGVVGALIWVVVFGAMYWLSFQALRAGMDAARPRDLRALAIAQFLIMIAGLAEALGISAPEISAMAIPYFFIPGLVVGATLTRDRSR